MNNASKICVTKLELSERINSNHQMNWKALRASVEGKERRNADSEIIAIELQYENEHEAQIIH